MTKVKTHIRRADWMTESRYNSESVCTTMYKADAYVFVPPENATCGSCLRIWVWEAWRTGRLVRREVQP